MKIFDLTLETYPVSNTETQVILKPSDLAIENYIADCVVISGTPTEELLNNHKIEMREILFNKFKELESVEQSLKDEYIL